MQLALHVHEIDQHLVDELVRVVTDFFQQPAERVLDRAGGRDECPWVLTVQSCRTFFPTYIFGISMPSGKIRLSLSSGDLNR